MCIGNEVKPGKEERKKERKINQSINKSNKWREKKERERPDELISNHFHLLPFYHMCNIVPAFEGILNG